MHQDYINSKCHFTPYGAVDRGHLKDGRKGHTNKHNTKMEDCGHGLTHWVLELVDVAIYSHSNVTFIATERQRLWNGVQVNDPIATEGNTPSNKTVWSAVEATLMTQRPLTAIC